MLSVTTALSTHLTFENYLRLLSKSQFYKINLVVKKTKFVLYLLTVHYMKLCYHNRVVHVRNLNWSNAPSRKYVTNWFFFRHNLFYSIVPCCHDSKKQIYIFALMFFQPYSCRKSYGLVLMKCRYTNCFSLFIICC